MVARDSLSELRSRATGTPLEEIEDTPARMRGLSRATLPDLSG